MNEQYLTLPQNLCSARIFLNIFGLVLEDKNDINEFSKVKIFEKKMNEVGNLYFDNGKIIITANYNNTNLEANYDISKITSLIDREDENALFSKWSSKIIFKFQNNNIMTLDGEILINCSIDSKFGINCTLHPLINGKIPNKGQFNLSIIRDGSPFKLEIKSEEHYELINLIPWEQLYHETAEGKYDPNQKSFPYRKLVGISNAAEYGEDKDKLAILLFEREQENVLSYRNEKVPKDKINNYNVIQQGLLMQQLNPDMIKRINQLRDLLLIGDNSLLDNIISVCYDSYSDEEIEALLGIKRCKMTYQDGNESLINSYYGIGKDSKFLTKTEQKRLLKNNFH